MEDERKKQRSNRKIRQKVLHIIYVQDESMVTYGVGDSSLIFFFFFFTNIYYCNVVNEHFQFGLFLAQFDRISREMIRNVAGLELVFGGIKGTVEGSGGDLAEEETRVNRQEGNNSI